ncbi:MAG: methionyl-tRNA formyltransferase [Pseudomonadota bacterium]
MRLIFAGTPAFAATALEAVLAAGHVVSLVLTQPDRPAGRGMSLHASPVKQYALAAGLPVLQATSLKDEATQAQLHAQDADCMVVAAYGLLLPPAVLAIPRFGCINIHASLLPRWRGAAPIQRAILAGDAESGVCIMQMDSGLDTGAILRSAALPLSTEENAATLHNKLAAVGARLLVETLAEWPRPAMAQTSAGATYATKIVKAEAALDWRLAASQLDRQIRAFNPAPGAFFVLQGSLIKIWQASVVSMLSPAPPGTVLQADQNGLVVACGTDALRLSTLQKAGAKRLAAAQFLAGTPLLAGQNLLPSAEC